MLLGFFIFSFIDASAKWMALLGMPVLVTAFLRYIGHFGISLGLVLKNGMSLSSFRTPRFGLVLLRALFILACTGLNFSAVRYLPLTLTSTILFTSPLIVCALSGPLLGEKVGIWRWGAIAVGFIGLVIAIRPFDTTFHWAIILSVINAISFALYIITTRKLSGDVDSDIMQFYAAAAGLILLAPFAVLQWQNPGSAINWMILLAMGVWGWLGHEFITRAHSYAGATALTPFSYSYLIYVTIWSTLLFNQWPDVWTVIGGGVIITTGLFIWFRERREGI
jgi:drug/metabolite transporter (DMT)-like permease